MGGGVGDADVLEDGGITVGSLSIDVEGCNKDSFCLFSRIPILVFWIEFLCSSSFISESNRRILVLALLSSVFRNSISVSSREGRTGSFFFLLFCWTLAIAGSKSVAPGFNIGRGACSEL